MRLLSIVGARPQFIKLAPLARALAAPRDGGEAIEHLIVHTGQHYDAAMSGVFFDELGIPCPSFHLDAGSGSHGSQTGRILTRAEAVLLEARPDMVLVYGDTNSTLGGALAAAKLRFPLIHIEAGVRSFNRRMPEEVNRVATDHIADLLLAPTRVAVRNLAAEGLSQRTALVGDVMYDAVLAGSAVAESRSEVLKRLGLEHRGYALATVHRAENTDDGERLRGLLEAFDSIAASGLRIVLPMHPRTRKVISEKIPGWSPHRRLRAIEPLGYMDMLCLTRHARLTLTDSGGVQKEAFFLGCPCVTLREETEWVETVEAGANLLAGVGPESIHDAVSAWEDRWSAGGDGFRDSFAADASRQASVLFGEGRAAENIVRALVAAHDMETNNT